MSRHRMYGVALTGLLVITVLASCSTSDGRSADFGAAYTPTLSELTDGPWVADRVGEEGPELVSGSTITITFEEDALVADAGCNTMRGGASIDGVELVVSDLASTMMACDDALMEQDEWLSTFLSSRPTIELLDDDLWLSKDEVVVHLVRT